MKTIFYLIDLYKGRMIEAFKGEDDRPPVSAFAAAERRAENTGHTHILARGSYSFQRECYRTGAKVRRSWKRAKK